MFHNPYPFINFHLASTPKSAERLCQQGDKLLVYVGKILIKPVTLLSYPTWPSCVNFKFTSVNSSKTNKPKLLRIYLSNYTDPQVVNIYANLGGSDEQLRVNCFNPR